ncbi:aminopeptidase [Ramicandelaber brevisporus]|nr:aminopeptidase [Ramicandelaber brevisporus]
MSPSTSVVTAPSSNREVLPDSVVPSHYNLLIAPILAQNSFSGSVEVSLIVRKPTNVVVINAHQLDITAAHVTLQRDGAEVHIGSAGVTYDTDKQQASIHLDDEAGLSTDDKSVTLHINYSGIIAGPDVMTGFYSSVYKGQDDVEQWMYSVMNCPAYARTVFPGFDEPARKATFDITLRIPQHLTGLSNMPVRSETIHHNSQLAGLKDVTFVTTPLLSTYLVTFAFGDFDYVEAFSSGEHNGQPVQCRVYTPRGLGEQGRFALKIATQCVEYYAGPEVFGVPYMCIASDPTVVPKLDLIAVTSFYWGALECPGLVLFRLSSLLMDEKNSSERAKRNLASIVAHELGHVGAFGDVVSPEFWNGLWLNESFTSWICTEAVDKLYPQWNVWAGFLTSELGRALQLDALKSSHPIEVEVNRPSDVNQVFDGITYSKGASVISMIASHLTLDVFMRGVRIYVRRFAFANATTEDLLQALTEASGVDVATLADNWLKKTGFPLISARLVSSGSSVKLQVRQSRYLATAGRDATNGTAADDDTIWWVPLNVWVSGHEEPLRYVLTEREQTFALPAGFNPQKDLFKINAGTTGVYRVQYESEISTRLGQAVQKGTFGINDRVGLISDAGALAQSGHIRSSVYLSLLDSYTNEDSEVPWNDISSRLGQLFSAFSSQSDRLRAGLSAFSSKLYGSLAWRFGFDAVKGESESAPLLRAIAIGGAANAGHPETLKEARRRFDIFFNNGDSSVIPSNLLGAIFGPVVRHGGEREFELVYKYAFNKAIPADQRNVALASLGATKQDALIDRYLQMSLDPTLVPSQDMPLVWNAAASNPLAKHKLWNLFKSNWNALSKRFESSVDQIGKLASAAISELNTEEDIKDIREFFQGKKTGHFTMALEQSVEKVGISASWASRDAKDVENFLASNDY